MNDRGAGSGQPPPVGMKVQRLKDIDALKSLRAKLQKSELRGDRKRVKVCCGTACSAMGSMKIAREFARKSARDGNEVEVVKTGCQGLCQKGPILRVEPQGYFYQKGHLEHVDEIYSKTFGKGVPARRFLYRESVAEDPLERAEDIPFYKKQVRVTLKNNGSIDPCNIHHYIAVGGYAALEKALSAMTPRQVLKEIVDSNLRGRGGAGFPTGRKWTVARDAPGEVKFVVANGDEGDPGAFMDRSLMEGDPQSLLEGMLLCAYTIGARFGFVYVRHEYPLAVKNLRTAVRQAEELGLLGRNILGTGLDLTVVVREGAGAFVCGEETALLSSIEGRRGFPRSRPPYPAEEGLWGYPTLINNVETFSQVPHIVLNGSEHYRAIGTENSPGTKVFALTGKVVNTGLIEVPMGITLKEIIYDIGGGILGGRKFKAVQTGGPSGGCLSEEELDLPIDYDSLISAGSMMGSGGLVVMDEDNCMVDIAKFFLSFTQKESCGKCPPCRIGTYQMIGILEKITSGEGDESDLEELERLANVVKRGSLCGLGQTAPNPVLSTLRYFRDEYEEHIKDKFCRANVCTGIGIFRIDGSTCFLCGLCKEVCDHRAVKETREGYYIDKDYCTKCKACYYVCPVDAVKIGKEVLPWVIPEQCEGCSDCVDACIMHGIKMYETDKEGIYLPWLSNPDVCVSCERCAAVCATGGIVMTTHIGEATERLLKKRPWGLKLGQDEPGGEGEAEGEEVAAEGRKED